MALAELLPDVSKAVQEGTVADAGALWTKLRLACVQVRKAPASLADLSGDQGLWVSLSCLH